ncbi:MAG: DUF4038 domain-containing protein [Candidatus Brocadiia bacterium]
MARPTVRVPRWEPHDFAFRSAARPANPFRVAFCAEVRGPGGVGFLAPGFYDGRGTWKVRLAPTEEGRWSVVTRSQELGLAGARAELECVPPRQPGVHGGLRVDPRHPHHFVFEDGTRYFLLGYECDWLWALDMARPGLDTLAPFLDKLAAHGFNHVLLNAYAHDCPWQRGRTGPHDYGPPPRFAWRGSNARPRHGRMNLAYWRHYDRVVRALGRRGMIAHVMAKVYNKGVNWPAKGSGEDDLFFRWLAARYAPFPNVVWDFSKEAHNEPDMGYKLCRLRLLRASDPYRRLLTVHDDAAAYDRGDYDGVLDFRSDQQHSDWHPTVLRQRGLRAWPVVNVEFGYEHGPGGLEDRTYVVVQPPREVVRRAWEIATAGGYTAYYYTYTAWDVVRPADTPPGYAYFRRLREFFEGTRYWELGPADELARPGRCLAAPGREYVVFLDRAQPVELELRGLAAPLQAEWYHPLTGARRSAGRLGEGTARLVPPADWEGQMAALHARPPSPPRPGSSGRLNRQAPFA